MAARAKLRTVYFCTRCGAEHPKWQGQCRECEEWNSLAEERVTAPKSGKKRQSGNSPVSINNIETSGPGGYQTGLAELDRVLGGWLVPGATVLLGGEPGIGKSTLLLQAAAALARQGPAVLYVTGEESLAQVKLRAERLSTETSSLAVLQSASIEEIIPLISRKEFAAVLVDSIQSVASAELDSPPGTIGQIRESAAQLIRAAKEADCALFLVGHVTKDGAIAGPKILEHMVDTVIYFEGDSAHLYRMLRVTKNRFGSATEIGLFQMTGQGLEEVANPAGYFLTGAISERRPGTAVTALCEGNRPLLVEVQALVSPATYGTPQRVAGGLDNKRLSLLLAILEKRCQYELSSRDVFVSVAGGLRLSEPATDLAVVAAIISSLLNRPVVEASLLVGEVGLSGEVRGVTMIDRRVAEAAKLGFSSAVIPKANEAQLSDTSAVVRPVSDLQTALEEIID